MLFTSTSIAASEWELEVVIRRASQNFELKILAKFRILERQTLKFKSWAKFKFSASQNFELKILTDFHFRLWSAKIVNSRFWPN